MGWVANATLRPLYPENETRYPLYRRLGGPQGRSGRMREISLLPGFDSRIVQPVASRYTDWAMPTHLMPQYRVFFSSFTDKRRPNAPPVALPALPRTPEVGEVQQWKTGDRQTIALVITFRNSSKHTLQRTVGAFRSNGKRNTLYLPVVWILFPVAGS